MGRDGSHIHVWHVLPEHADALWPVPHVLQFIHNWSLGDGPGEGMCQEVAYVCVREEVLT
jgi:hypothetical protein